MAMLCGLPDTKQDYMTKNRFSEGIIILLARNLIYMPCGEVFNLVFVGN